MRGKTLVIAGRVMMYSSLPILAVCLFIAGESFIFVILNQEFISPTHIKVTTMLYFGLGAFISFSTLLMGVELITDGEKRILKKPARAIREREQNQSHG